LNSSQPSASRRGIFVTGTDTGVGKTLVATALLRAFARSGLRAVGMKPVATGCRAEAENRANEDVAALIRASNVRAPIDLINPYCFEPPIAPHLAARRAGGSISRARICDSYTSLARLADVVVVEGAGGLLVPLNGEDDFADLAQALRLPLVLVVGMRLGCLNHALLTAEAISNRGLPLAGWVANRIDATMSCFDENLETLRARLPAPLIGSVPVVSDAEQACAAIDLDLLRG
jgi:dethiobiotin synthetase